MEKTKNDYIVQEMNKEFIKNHDVIYEHYVLVQSRTMTKIYGKKQIVPPVLRGWMDW